MGSAKIYLQNNTDSVADLMYYHMSANYGTVGMSGYGVAPGDSIGPLNVSWDTATPSDFWYASIAVHGGSNPGMYVSYVSYDVLLPYWKECMLEGEWGFGDDGTSPTFTVDWNTFSINLKSGGCSADMLRIGNYSPVWNVFVLMLENHSFDNIFAYSGIKGITVANASDCNSYQGVTYCVTDSPNGSPTPPSMPTDPGHEFTDVIQQLCGLGTQYTGGQPYPAINMSGFAATYATSADEKTGLPTQDQIGDIMACFQTPIQLPNINKLATNYVICDQWFSSLPGPTWPNRFYVHGASSAYWNPMEQYYQSLDDSPTTPLMGLWESIGGFTYRSGSIFDALNNANIPWMIYYDDSGNISGSVPQVASLKNISVAETWKVKSLSDMQNDLQNAYPYRYTFIEPNYGNILNNTYEGGSSQHPMDDVSGGENIIANVVNSIAQSPLWPNSLLIITYDEHGGFYDSVAPAPNSTVAPNPGDEPGTNGFTFTQLGVRVPAVIVSPLVTVGPDHTLYDHSSVPATIERLFGLQPLTARDAVANDFMHLLSSDANAVRTERPPNLDAGRPSPPKPPVAAEKLAALAQEPLPESGNLLGVLAVAQKTDIELSSGAPVERAAIVARVQAARTRGDADAYIREVMAKVRAARVSHRAAVRAAVARQGSKKR
jgi:phospholipase C